MAESFPNGWKTLWEKEKFLLRSNFSFSHGVFKRPVLSTCINQGLLGKGLIYLENNVDQCQPMAYLGLNFVYACQKTSLLLDSFVYYIGWIFMPFEAFSWVTCIFAHMCGSICPDPDLNVW